MNIMMDSKSKELEKIILEAKHEALRMTTIEMFVKKYSNNMELGAAVRKFVTIKEKSK